MKRFAGLDGYRKGWVVVWIEGRERRFETIADVATLFAQSFDRAAIDIPIGAPDSGTRGCDVEAQTLLGPNRSRVFTGVRRWMLGLTDFAAINERAWANGEKGISLQMLHILPKIAQVDAVITPRRQTHLLESHPELIFQRLNRDKPLVSKKTRDGYALRRALLEADGFRDLDVWLKALRGTGAKPDDLFDACACAIAARDSKQRVPAKPLRDTRGLAMTINY